MGWLPEFGDPLIVLQIMKNSLSIFRWSHRGTGFNLTP
jgi:hypothetical protein